MIPIRYLPTLLVFVLLAGEAGAIYIQVDDADKHDWDRTLDIDVSRSGKQFIGYNFDWSGVGRSDDGRWATMISDQYFLSANHFHPGISSTITYYVRNFSDGSVTTVTADVAEGQQISGTDIWVGKLDAPVPSVTWYNIFSGALSTDYEALGQEDLNETLPDLYLNPDDVTNLVLMVGKSGVNGTNSFRVGLNASSNFRTDQLISGDPVGHSIDYAWTPADHPFAGFTDHEAYLVSGDSGAPTFYADFSNTNTIVGSGLPSTLQILGIHAGNSSGPTPSQGSWSADSLPGEYLTEIDAIINPVPEPAHFGLFAGLLALLWMARKRFKA